jgi:MFS family permease
MRYLVNVDPPIRRLAACTFLNRLGNGILLVLVPVYFVRHLGFDLIELGLTFGTATAIAVLIPVPTGALIERTGPRGVYRTALFALAVCSVAPALTSRVWPTAAAWLLVSVVEAAFGTSNQVMMADSSTAGSAARSKGFLRAMSNVAMSLGSAAAGVVLVVDDTAYFRLALLANALLTLGAWALSARLPPVSTPPRYQAAARRGDAFRDAPYVVTAIGIGLASAHFAAVEVALALFLVERTDVPGWGVSAFLVTNTIGVAVSQTHIASRCRTLLGGGRFLVIGAAVVLVGLAAVGLCARAPADWQVALLLLAALVYTVGETVASAGEWTLLFDSVPPGRQGAYQGFASASQAGFDAASRAVVAGVCVAYGGAGWLAIGLVGLAGSLLAAAMVPKLQRRLPATSATAGHVA